MKLVLVALGSLTVLTLLFIQTRASDVERHHHVIETLRRLKQLDTTLNQDMLKISAGMLPHYDSLVATGRDMRELHATLKAGRYAIYGTARSLDERVDAYEQTLAQKQALLEVFKSESSILRNSLRYLPAAAGRLVGANTAPAIGDRELREALDDLLRDTLVYTVSLTGELRVRALARIDALRRSLRRIRPEHRVVVENILVHAQTVLTHKAEVDALLAQIASVPTDARNDDLFVAYTIEYERSVRRTSIYRFYLYAASVLLLLAVASSLIRLQRSNDELKRRAGEQRSLVEIGRLLASTLSLGEVLDRLAETAHTLLRVDVVRVWLRDEGTASLVLQSTAGAARSEVSQAGRLAPGEGLVGRLVAERRPLAMPDVLRDPALQNRAWFEAEGIVSFLGVPLLLDGAPVGALVGMTRSRRAWSSEEVALAEALAVPAAIAIRNAQLYERLRVHQARLGALLEGSRQLSRIQPVDSLLASIAKSCGELFDAASVGVRLLEGEDLVLRGAAGDAAEAMPTRTLKVGESLSGIVAATGEPLIVDDLARDPRMIAPHREAAARLGHRGWLGVPIKVGDRVVGVLSVRTPREHGFSTDDLALASAFASQTATGLENARLYQEAKRAYEELSVTQKQLTQASKMEAVGRLAGGVAHDFNNLLTIIIGRSQILLRRVPPVDPRRRDLELIGETALRASNLTRQLLAFSRKQVIEAKVLALNEVIANIDKMLRRVIGEDVEFATILEPGLGRVKADPNQIEQILINLAVNARDAMPTGGTLTITTADVELDDTFVRRHTGARPGPHVMLRVSDTGRGMDAEIQSHVFEPFFTTKEVGSGTGLGLATVYGIVKQSNGYITVESEVGRGATFTLYLPRVETAAEPSEASAAPVARTRGSETVLLVEDEGEVRELAREILTMHGYAVLDAPDAETALAIGQRSGGSIRLLLTDVVMPRMGGRELAERLSAAHPALKVIYMSGYTNNAVVRHGVLDRSVNFLQKPFTPDRLAQKVREVLEAGADRAAV